MMWPDASEAPIALLLSSSWRQMPWLLLLLSAGVGYIGMEREDVTWWQTRCPRSWLYLPDGKIPD